MDNKDNYSPKEVAEIIGSYLDLVDFVEEFRAYTSKPNHNKQFAEIQRDVIRKKFESQIPRNVLEGLGLEDVLQAGNQRPLSK